jgi:deoxyribonuclease-4
MSIAGGLHLAFERLREVGGEALQIFIKNQRQWRAPEIKPESAERFRKSWEESGFIPMAVHDTYLINLAATDALTLERSISALVEELGRTAILGIPYVIMHPGSHMGQGIEAGLERFVKNLDTALSLSDTPDVSILIENTAGQGTQLGSTFEEIGYILNSSRLSHRLGVCFDTCHGFGAGYDIRDPEHYTQVFSEFDRCIGLARLKYFHLNDSKKELGSRVDRHEHIGKGKIGLEGFRLLLNDPRFELHPMVIETPKENGLDRDRENLKLLRSLLGRCD